MRPQEEFKHVIALVESGMNDCEIARLTGIPRGTIIEWRHKSSLGWAPGLSAGAHFHCPICNDQPLDGPTYAYLFGMYLGDGYLSLGPRGLYRLRIAMDQKYPHIMAECIDAINTIKSRGKPASRVHAAGCDEIYSYWKHWICLFPHYGPGPKHLRNIELETWQKEIVTEFPELLIRGLIQSDGCRYTNRVNRGYEYISYNFTNNSLQIQRIFADACDQLGIRWRQATWKNIAITRRPDVAILDLIVGPKS